MTTRLRIAAACLVIVTGCLKQHNPYYCPGLNPDDNCAESAGQSCHDSADCPAAAPFCDVTGGMRCRGCRSHGECPLSNACLPTGACADAKDVSYASSRSGTDTLTCGPQDSPCATIGTALARSRPYLRLAGAFDEALLIDRSVTLLADPGTTLTRTGLVGPAPHNVIAVIGASVVAIADLTIQGSPGTDTGLVVDSGSPVVTLHHVTMSDNNGPGGAITISGGTLHLDRSMITGNHGGGVSITGAEFEIENNFILSNGNPQSSYGGVFLNIPQATGTHVLRFNTIAANAARIGAATGIECVLVGDDLPFSSNIIFSNMSREDPVNGTHCFGTYSDIELSLGMPPGMGNRNEDPLFVNPAGGDFHLQARSPEIDRGEPNSTVDIDIDGDPRPQNGINDIGADEYVAPR